MTHQKSKLKKAYDEKMRSGEIEREQERQRWGKRIGAGTKQQGKIHVNINASHDTEYGDKVNLLCVSV